MSTSEILKQIKPLSLHEKTLLIKAIVDMIEEDKFVDLVSASKSSMDFWDNSIDDEVWNNEN